MGIPHVVSAEAATDALSFSEDKPAIRAIDYHDRSDSSIFNGPVRDTHAGLWRNRLVKETIEAVYENGVFRPTKKPQIPPGQRVRFEIEVPEPGDPDEILELATSVLNGLSESDIDEIESIVLDRDHFFHDGARGWPNA